MSLFPYRQAACLVLVSALFPAATRAWDYQGHWIVNQLALAALPPEYPQFVHAEVPAGRVAFLSGEPDRWRNVPDLPLKHANSLDHFCDLEYITLAGLDWEKVSPLRYEFVAQFAAARQAHQRNFPAIDPARNSDRTREWPGFAPWTITEYYGKLRSAFSYLKVYEELGTPEEVAQARATIVDLMGVMGHYVGDCAQPLHTTMHYNGWIGENPKGYTTWSGLHAWIDGGIIAKAGITVAPLRSRLRIAQPLSAQPRKDRRDPIFSAVVTYLHAQHAHVEKIYQLEKAGRLGQGDRAMTDETRRFIEARLIDGGRMLAALWLTAYRNAVPDTFLRSALLRRQGSTPASRQ